MSLASKLPSNLKKWWQNQLVFLIIFAFVLTSKVRPGIVSNGAGTNQALQDSIKSVEGHIKKLARLQKYRQAILYSQELLRLTETLKDSNSIAKANFRLGFYYLKLGELHESYIHYNYSYKIHITQGDSISAASRLISMANIQNLLGDYYGSRITATDALALLGNSGEYHKLSSVYHLVSVSYKEQNNYEQALKWSDSIVNMTLIHPGEIPDESRIIYQNTRANILADLGRFDSGIAILKKLLKGNRVLTDEIEYARVVDNLGRIRWHEDPYNRESENLFHKALYIREKNKDIPGLIASNIHLAKYYAGTDDRLALYHASRALRNAERLKNSIAALEALDLIIPLKGKLRIELINEANLYTLKSNKLKDAQQAVRDIYAISKYSNDKLTFDNLSLKLVATRREKQIVISLLGLFSIGVVLIISTLYFAKRRKRETMHAIETTKSLLSRKIHDELSNDIYRVMARLEQTSFSTDILTILQDIYERTRNIARESNPVNLDSDFKEELSIMLSGYVSKDTRLILKGLENLNWQRLSEEKKVTLYRILQEFMTNMNKHSKANFVVITFNMLPRLLRVSYMDNGIGTTQKDHSFYKEKGGLLNAENSILSIKGRLTFRAQSDNGFGADLEIPI